MNSSPARFTSVEATLDKLAHAVLDRMPKSGRSGALVEFVVFGLKQGWACLFGGLMLGLIIGTKLVWPEHAIIARYDFFPQRCSYSGFDAGVEAGNY